MGDAGPLTPSPEGFRRAHIDVRPRHRQLPPVEGDNGDVKTLAELIEFNAKYNPHHVFCLQTLPGFDQHKTEEENFLYITHSGFRDAIGTCQEWLLKNIPEIQLPSKDEKGAFQKGPTIAVFMESDICLLTYLAALIGLGVPVLLLSARLSGTAIENLLRKTDARWILTTKRLQHKGEEGAGLMKEEGDLKPSIHLRAEFGELYKHERSTQARSICTPGHYIDEFDRRVLILHSSGTTGLPKPIFQGNRYVLGYAACQNLPESFAGRRNVSTLPLYHGFGLLAPGLSMSIGLTVCFSPSTIIPNANSTMKILGLARADSVMTVPSILEEIAMLPEKDVLNSLGHLDFVLWGGGPLKSIIREKLAAWDLNLVNHSGATEVGALGSVFVPDTSYDSRYIRFRQDLDLDFAKADARAGESEQWTMTAHSFGWDEPFILQDRLLMNPARPGEDFEVLGRNDDLLVLATGEKVQPQILELTLASRADVKAALAFGEGQFEVGVVVETQQPVEDMETFKSQLWPTILEAGQKMDSHGRVSSLASVLVVPPGTMPRSDKGSVQRKEAYKKLDQEITRIYQQLENQAASDTAIDSSSPGFSEELKDFIIEKLDWQGRASDFEVETDFFEFGMDSLQAVKLRRALLPTLLQVHNLDASSIPRDFLYRYPSVGAISRFFQTPEEQAGAGDEKQQAIESLVQGQSQKLAEMEHGACVVLTGSTGSLGSHLVQYFCESAKVIRVICLVRKANQAGDKSSPLERQIQAVTEKRLLISAEGLKKLEVIETSTAEPHLGLPMPVYHDLSSSVTHILHNAWPVDFMRHLPSFGAQFDTLREFIHLAREVHRRNPAVRPTVQFVSSIATIGRYGEKHDCVIVPEGAIWDVACTNGIGYAEAKLACEMMLERAAVDCGDEIDVRYVRVGQMSGARKTGYWKSSEHFPALIKSSVKLGVLPQVPGVCIPSDGLPPAE
jgi:acyl-CoA synthetase (AMP-forming)/AMP-acid ligase II/nucleoside-diphosphate-sugar epimerase/acyl carrier protein